MNPTPEDLAAARDLLRTCLRPASMADLIGDDDNLAQAGVDSLATIELITRCEDTLGRDLTDEESTTLDTVTAIARLLATGPDGQEN